MGRLICKSLLNASLCFELQKEDLKMMVSNINDSQIGVKIKC